MTQETIPYLHGNVMVGGVIGGAQVIDGKPYLPAALDLMSLDPKLIEAIRKAQTDNPGWRAPSWWYESRLEDGNEPSHYANYLSIPMVKERLFGWQALDGNVRIRVDLTVPGENGAEDTVIPVEFPVSSYKGIIREDKLLKLYQAGLLDDAALTDEVLLGMHSDDYTQHQLAQTFITETAGIVGGTDNLGITSAGLLRGGRVAWMEISIPEELHNDSVGFGYRPNLVVSTSFNGSLPTSWTRTVTATVCDNTLQYALRQAGETGKFRVRHTKNSLVHIRTAAQALGLIQQQADAFDETLKSWAETEVTEGQFNKWLDAMLPVPDLKTEVIKSEQGEAQTKVKTNSQSLVLNKRDKIETLWTSDPRVSPWRGTLLGIHQAWNTFNQHEAMVKGVKSFGGNKLQARVESNMFKTLKTDKNGVSEFEKSDELAMAAIGSILAESETAEKTTIAVGASTAKRAPAKKAAPRKSAAK